MADSDGNPPDSSDPRPTPPPQAKPVAPAPRSNPPNINAGKEKPPAAGGPPGFNDFMEWMRAQQATAGEGTTDQRTLIPKERKKFQRQDAEAKGDKPVAPAVPATAAPVEQIPPSTQSTPSALPVEPRPAADAPVTAVETPSPRVRRGQKAATKRNSWIGGLVQGVVLVLLVGSFFLGRASVKKIAPAPNMAPSAPVVSTRDGNTTTNLLSSANAALIDQATAETQATHFKEATEALEKVKASGEHVYGLTLQLALLAVYASDYTRAIPLLNEAIGDGDDIAEAYSARAVVALRRSTFRPGATNDFETAAKLEPFNARTFFYWGSALRRSGKSQEAITRLQQALDRLREPTAEGYYRLILRTTQIEIGQEKDFADELARQIVLPHPNIDWLFTAAALALRDGKYDAAAADLDRAEQCGDPDGFAMRLRDYYFFQYSTRKELVRFFAKLAPPKPGRTMTAPVPDASPAPDAAAAPPASPGATVTQ